VSSPESVGSRQRAGRGTLFFLTGAAVSFAAVLTVGLAIAAIGLTESKVPAGTGGSAAVSGAEVYAQNCASCHGSEGEGGIGPQLAGVVAERYPDINIHVLVVEQGRRAMPSFGSKLSADQILAVVTFQRDELGSAAAPG